jgi:hypothetical protein
VGSGTTLAFAGLVSAKNYQDLIAWKRAMDLVETVYRESVVMPADERFGLTAQMRRAAVSVPANIAEGQGRRTAESFSTTYRRRMDRSGNSRLTPSSQAGSRFSINQLSLPFSPVQQKSGDS